MKAKRFLWIILKGWLCFAIVCFLLHPLFRKNASPLPPRLHPQNISPIHQERVLCIDDNQEALLWRLRAINSAKEDIVLSTFAFNDDRSGTHVISALKDAADRGVHVRILIDGMHGIVDLGGSQSFKALAAHPNVEAKLYNKISLLKPWKVHYRLHEKYLIIDDSFYLLGGRNTNDLFLGEYMEKRNIDRDILVYSPEGNGSSMQQLKTCFEMTWNLKDCSLIKGRENPKVQDKLDAHYATLQQDMPEAFVLPDLTEKTFSANSVTLLTTSRETKVKQPILWETLCAYMDEGQDVLIQTPYLICNKEMYSGLARISQNSQQFYIITNDVSGGANPWGCADYLNQKNNIMKTGADIFEFCTPYSSHTKTILVDTSTCLIGSFNLDMRSTYLDTEMMLAIDCPQLNEQLRQEANDLIEHSNHVSPDGTETPGPYYVPKKVSLPKRMIRSLLRVLILPARHLL